MTRLTDSVFDPAAPGRWFIWGMPLSGKTSLGKKLKKILPFPVFDLDAELEKRTQKTVSRLFAEEGEAAFRRQESALLREIAADHPRVLVVTGGGTPCFAGNAAWMLDSGTCLFMHTSMQEIVRRAAVSAGRPLLDDDPPARLAELYAVRLPVYRTAHAEFFSEAEALAFFAPAAGR